MNISATIIKDSISKYGNRITTFELVYPRFIHSEFMTHRMLSKNAASSRAVPVNTMLGLIDTDPAMPVHWGKNQPGMSAREELNDIEREAAKATWVEASKHMISVTKVLNDIGLHKQVANRLCEPWQWMKIVVTGTEWENLFWLRYHDAAQPEFFELAKCMRYEMDNSRPFPMDKEEWHLPYVSKEQELDLGIETALKVSASCCAQVSYRKSDDSVEKAIDIYNKLMGLDRRHSSPFEHQAKAMVNYCVGVRQWEPGVTHMDRKGDLWSGNFKGWIQHRQLIPNHVKEG